jgi:hypothetical protein
MDDDFMEIGDTGLISKEDGWFYNVNTNKYISPEGEECDPEDYKAITETDKSS